MSEVQLVPFTRLAGVPLRYDRDPAAPYGSRGRAFRFLGQQTFVRQLDDCLADLWRVSGLGKAEVITSAGAFTRKPGQHGVGLAIDLDAVHWESTSLVTLRDGFLEQDRSLYYAVECVLRLHFGQVLNCDYDAAHQDHFHVDCSQPVGFRPESRALMLFCQGALRSIHERSLSVNGDFGQETQMIIDSVLNELGIGADLSRLVNWRAFLLATARRGFAQSAVRRHRPAHEGVRRAAGS